MGLVISCQEYLQISNRHEWSHVCSNAAGIEKLYISFAGSFQCCSFQFLVKRCNPQPAIARAGYIRLRFLPPCPPPPSHRGDRVAEESRCEAGGGNRDRGAASTGRRRHEKSSLGAAAASAFTRLPRPPLLGPASPAPRLPAPRPSLASPPPPTPPPASPSAARWGELPASPRRPCLALRRPHQRPHPPQQQHPREGPPQVRQVVNTSPTRTPPP